MYIHITHVYMYIYIYIQLDTYTNYYYSGVRVFLTDQLFGYSLEPTLILPKVPGWTCFPDLTKVMAFAAAPLVLTPFVRNQLVHILHYRILYCISYTDMYVYVYIYI